MDEELEQEIAAAMGTEETISDAPEPEPEPDDEPTPDPQPEPNLPPEPDSEALIEERTKEWERVTKYLARNLGEIEGDDAIHYVECPVCRAFGTPGFVVPGPVPQEIHGVLYEWLNIRPNEEYRTDEYSKQCPHCDGLGEVLTGSKVAGRDKLPCIDCQGDGWIATGEQRRKDRLFASNGASHTAVEAPLEGYTPPSAPDDVPAEVAALRAAGYTVLPPFVPSA